jgi:hypothetical protein
MAVLQERQALTQNQYNDLLYVLMKQVEETGVVKLAPDVDSEHIPSIEISFNIGANLSILQRQRTVLEYLLSPISRVVDQAARER